MANPKLVLNRNYTLSTRNGHSITFVKNEPTHVPPAAYADAIAVGAQPEDGSDANLIRDEISSKAPADPSKRIPLILAAIVKLVATNTRKDFTAAGQPAVKAVERELGFDVDGREVAEAWQDYHDSKEVK